MFKHKNHIIIRILALFVIQAFCVTQAGFSMPAGTRQDYSASKLRQVNVYEAPTISRAIGADFGITDTTHTAGAVGLTPEKSIELLDKAGLLLTRHLRIDTVVTEKVALHLAMRELMASEKIIMVTAQPTAYSSLNNVFGHATVDKGTDAFARAAHEFISRYLRENFSEEELKFYATYYNPYGGRWSFVFTQSAASKIDLEEFNSKLTKFLDNMLKDAVGSARQTVGLRAEDYPGAFNYIAGVSNLVALQKTYKRTKLYRQKAKNVVLNALYAANRYRPDAEISYLIKYIKNKPDITQADISKAQEILDSFKRNSASLSLRLVGQIYDLKGQIDAEYCKSFLEAAANNPRDLLVYAENQYFPNELKINEFGPRYWRRLHGITNGAAFSKAMPQDATRVFLHTPKVDSWIKQKRKGLETKRLFEYFGFPRRIPNFTYLNTQKRNLKDKLEAGSIDRNEALAEQGQAGRQLERDVVNLLKEEMRLTVTSEDGSLQGERVTNTLINVFLNRTKGVVFVSGDFNLLSQAPVDVGTKIKVKGMDIIRSVFSELGMIVVRVGNGDEWAAIGPPNIRSKNIAKAIRTINNRLANINNKFGEEDGLLFDGKPVTYRAQLRSGEIIENFTPSVACGVVRVSGNDPIKLRQRARLIPDKANFACEYAKDHGKGHRYYVTIPKVEKPLEVKLAEADLDNSIPDELLPYCGKLYEATESAIAIAAATGSVEYINYLDRNGGLIFPAQVYTIVNSDYRELYKIDDNIKSIFKEGLAQALDLLRSSSGFNFKGITKIEIRNLDFDSNPIYEVYRGVSRLVQTRHIRAERDGTKLTFYINFPSSAPSALLDKPYLDGYGINTFLYAYIFSFPGDIIDMASYGQTMLLRTVLSDYAEATRNLAAEIQKVSLVKTAENTPTARLLKSINKSPEELIPEALQAFADMLLDPRGEPLYNDINGRNFIFYRIQSSLRTNTTQDKKTYRKLIRCFHPDINRGRDELNNCFIPFLDLIFKEKDITSRQDVDGRIQVLSKNLSIWAKNSANATGEAAANGLSDDLMRDMQVDRIMDYCILNTSNMTLGQGQYAIILNRIGQAFIVCWDKGLKNEIRAIKQLTISLADTPSIPVTAILGEDGNLTLNLYANMDFNPIAIANMVLRAFGKPSISADEAKQIVVSQNNVVKKTLAYFSGIFSGYKSNINDAACSEIYQRLKAAFQEVFAEFPRETVLSKLNPDNLTGLTSEEKAAQKIMLNLISDFDKETPTPSLVRDLIAALSKIKTDLPVKSNAIGNIMSVKLTKETGLGVFASRIKRLPIILLVNSQEEKDRLVSIAYVPENKIIVCGDNPAGAIQQAMESLKKYYKDINLIRYHYTDEEDHDLNDIGLFEGFSFGGVVLKSNVIPFLRIKEQLADILKKMGVQKLTGNEDIDKEIYEGAQEAAQSL